MIPVLLRLKKSPQLNKSLSLYRPKMDEKEESFIHFDLKITDYWFVMTGYDENGQAGRLAGTRAGYLNDIYINRKRKGIGTFLMKKYIDYLKESTNQKGVHLVCPKDRIEPQMFFEKLGFVKGELISELYFKYVCDFENNNTYWATNYDYETCSITKTMPLSLDIAKSFKEGIVFDQNTFRLNFFNFFGPNQLNEANSYVLLRIEWDLETNKTYEVDIS